ncbi:MAG: tetratricopeptide repeat protein [Deltaproteobacteria bacterium]|nr:tetratricopeptide repeat protein [Deltaproteobacteria bacterium]
MSLIMEAIKKAQKLRLKELKKMPFLIEPIAREEKRRSEEKYFGILTIAGLGILLFVSFWASHSLSLLPSPQEQKAVSVERTEAPGSTETKREVQEPRQKEIPPLQIEDPLPTTKPSINVMKEEPASKKRAKEKKKMTGKSKFPSATIPVPGQSSPRMSPGPPKAEVVSKPLRVELKSEKAGTLTSEILSHFNLGVSSYQQREISKAIQAYKKVIELEPNYVEAYNNLGIIYQEIGDFAKALEAYQKSIAINPRYEKGHNNLGILLYLMDRHEESMAAFQKALAINSQNLESHINLGILFKKRGQMEKAIECYQKALVINPLYGEAHYNIGLLYEQLENSELAIGHYQRFIQLSSKTYPDLVRKVQRHLDYLMKVKRDKSKP